jgi:16S rRNA (cytidine1402-2'-O)-methyltransferase
MSETIQAGALYIVSTPIGNLSDISERALTILRGVDLIAAEDTRTSKILLDHFSIHKPLISYHGYNERRRAPELVRRLKEGASVAVVTDAGTPGISDPASVVIREAIAAGITVIPVPGASAILAALTVSGLPTDRFVFEGFLPVKKGRKTRLGQLALEERTLVLYESPHRLERTLGDLLVAFGDRPIVLVREITKKFEEVQRGTVSTLLENVRHRVPRGEYVLVIGGRTRKEREEDREEGFSTSQEPL